MDAKNVKAGVYTAQPTKGSTRVEVGRRNERRNIRDDRQHVEQRWRAAAARRHGWSRCTSSSSQIAVAVAVALLFGLSIVVVVVATRLRWWWWFVRESCGIGRWRFFLFYSLLVLLLLVRVVTSVFHVGKLLPSRHTHCCAQSTHIPSNIREAHTHTHNQTSFDLKLRATTTHGGEGHPIVACCFTPSCPLCIVVVVTWTDEQFNSSGKSTSEKKDDRTMK